MLNALPLVAITLLPALCHILGWQLGIRVTLHLVALMVTIPTLIVGMPYTSKACSRRSEDICLGICSWERGECRADVFRLTSIAAFVCLAICSDTLVWFLSDWLRLNIKTD